MFSGVPRPTIIAHRGASAKAPENTLAAFRLALKEGADAIELDAKLTSDKQVVVLHDQRVERTTDGSGKVGEMPLAALKELDAGSWFGKRFQGEKIPTLEEVLESVGKDTVSNIELTNYATPRDSLPEKVAALVKKHNLEEQILISSFNPWALIRARRELPQTPIGLLAVPGSKGAWARSFLGRLLRYQSLHPHHSDASKKFVERVHEWNSLVFTYTVNEEDEMRRLFARGVDGIFTDEPALGCRIREEVRH